VLKLKMLMKEGEENYLGIVWPKGTLALIEKQINEKQTPLFETLDDISSSKRPAGYAKCAKVLDNEIEVVLELCSSMTWAKDLNPEDFRLNSKVSVDLNENDEPDFSTVLLCGLSIVPKKEELIKIK